MKYINKKLPIIQIDKEIKFLPTGMGLHIYDNGDLHCSDHHKDKLISEGWIEEVKPREWWYCKDKSIEEFRMYPSPQYDGCVSHWGIAIKVREVIE